MPPRVLVADDDRALQVLLNVLLSRAGFEVDFAHDGQEALTKMNGDGDGDGHGGDGYAVVMLDLIMPEVSGIEILDRLRKQNPEMLKRVIVLMASAGPPIWNAALIFCVPAPGIGT